jgi:hypothetical protein
MAIVVVILAASVLVADIPPTLDEDRSQTGFCSPDCPLQRDAAHSLGVVPALAPRSFLMAPVRIEAEAVRILAHPAVVASSDAPRAPPSI